MNSVCFQTHDLLEAVRRDGVRLHGLKVDGGMVVNDWAIQSLADICNLPVERPRVMETTALGAAYLAGRQAGIYGDFSAFAGTWALDGRFEPGLPAEQRRMMLVGWRDAVSRTLSAKPAVH